MEIHVIGLLGTLWLSVNSEEPSSTETCLDEIEGPESLLVTTSSGPVRGYLDKKNDVYAFYGIPYATVPTGRERFKPPLPPPKWSEPFEAVNKTIICPQIKSIALRDQTMVEDCLVANIFVPNTKQKNLPVVVYVHGGAFQLGSGNSKTPKHLLEGKNLIVVTFNYRLGVYGFLCLGTEDVPGNAGMKDQVALLRWVEQNIGNFGGDPKNVTLAGYSAGAAAVDLLTLSPVTNGLFNKVIPESGSSIGSWSVQLDPLENARNFAIKHNFTNVNDIHALEDFYKRISLDKIITLIWNRTDNMFVFVPCVERKTEGEAFLTEAPIDILRSGSYKKLPTLYGFTKDEGMVRASLFDLWRDNMNKNFAEFLPADITFSTKTKKKNVAKLVKEFYFGETISNNSILQFIDYYKDLFFAYPILRTVNLHLQAGHKEIYLYEYTYSHDNAPYILNTRIRAVDHCAQNDAIMDDQAYKCNNNEAKLPDNYRKLKAYIRQMWKTFIITGKPVPKGSLLPPWPPVGLGLTPHMELGQIPQLKGPMLPLKFLFWEDIYKKNSRVPTKPHIPDD